MFGGHAPSAFWVGLAPFLLPMRHALVLVFLIAALAASMALPQTTPPASNKPPSTKSSTKKSATKTSATGASAKKTSAKKKTAKSAKRAPAVARQAAPTPERYKEIQQALIDKGYLKSEPTGVWDADSAAALTQFQNDRKLPPTGKLTAASLIALGLGPSTAGGVPPGGGGPINTSGVSAAPSDPPHSQAN